MLDERTGYKVSNSWHKKWYVRVNMCSIWLEEQTNKFVKVVWQDNIGKNMKLQAQSDQTHGS